MNNLLQKTTLEYLNYLISGSALGSFHKFGPLSPVLGSRLAHGPPTSRMGAIPPPTYFNCNCGQTFSTTQQLERHMNADHPNNKNMVSHPAPRSLIAISLTVTVVINSHLLCPLQCNESPPSLTLTKFILAALHSVQQAVPQPAEADAPHVQPPGWPRP